MVINLFFLFILKFQRKLTIYFLFLFSNMWTTDGQSTKIPSLPDTTNLKKCICVKNYPVFESFGFVWVGPNSFFCFFLLQKSRIYSFFWRYLHLSIVNWHKKQKKRSGNQWPSSFSKKNTKIPKNLQGFLIFF